MSHAVLAAKLPRIFCLSGAARSQTVTPSFQFHSRPAKRPANLRFNSWWLVQQPHQEPQTSGAISDTTSAQVPKRHYLNTFCTLISPLPFSYSFVFLNIRILVHFTTPPAAGFYRQQQNNTIATPSSSPFSSSSASYQADLRRIVRLGF